MIQIQQGKGDIYFNSPNYKRNRLQSYHLGLISPRNTLRTNKNIDTKKKMRKSSSVVADNISDLSFNRDSPDFTRKPLKFGNSYKRAGSVFYKKQLATRTLTMQMSPGKSSTAKRFFATTKQALNKNLKLNSQQRGILSPIIYRKKLEHNDRVREQTEQNQSHTLDTANAKKHSESFYSQYSSSSNDSWNKHGKKDILANFEHFHNHPTKQTPKVRLSSLVPKHETHQKDFMRQMSSPIPIQSQNIRKQRMNGHLKQANSRKHSTNSKIKLLPEADRFKHGSQKGELITPAKTSRAKNVLNTSPGLKKVQGTQLDSKSPYYAKTDPILIKSSTNCSQGPFTQRHSTFTQNLQVNSSKNFRKRLYFPHFSNLGQNQHQNKGQSENEVEIYKRLDHLASNESRISNSGSHCNSKSDTVKHGHSKRLQVSNPAQSKKPGFRKYIESKSAYAEEKHSSNETIKKQKPVKKGNLSSRNNKLSQIRKINKILLEAASPNSKRALKSVKR